MTSYLNPLFSVDYVLQIDYKQLAEYLHSKYNTIPSVKLKAVKQIQPKVQLIEPIGVARAMLESILDKVANKLNKQYNSFTCVLTDRDVTTLALLHPTGIMQQLKATIEELQDKFARTNLSAVISNTIRSEYGLKWQALDIILSYWVESESVVITNSLSEFYERCEYSAKYMYMFNKIGADLYITSEHQASAIEKLRYLAPRLKIARDFFDRLEDNYHDAEAFALFIVLWSLNKHGIPLKQVVRDRELQKLLGLPADRIQQLISFLKKHADKFNLPYLKQFIKQNSKLLLTS